MLHTPYPRQPREIWSMSGGIAIIVFFGMLPAAFGQENEAAKLFAAMEKKIGAAQAMRVKAEIQVTADTKAPASQLQGSLILTHENKMRFQLHGGEVEHRTWAMISDGANIVLRPYEAMPNFKEEARFETPKNLAAYFKRVVSRSGVFSIALGMPYNVFRALDESEKKKIETGWEVWDLDRVPSEKIAGRNAEVIRLKVGEKGMKRNPAVTIWLDSETLLPLKRVLDLRGTPSRAGEIVVTETYKEFVLDPKISSRIFTLPKPAVAVDENVPVENLPKAVRLAAEKRFPKARLHNAVLARPGSSWLTSGDKHETYFLDLSHPCSVPRYPFFRISLSVTPEGKLTQIVKEIVVPETPKEIKRFLDQNYPGEILEELLEFSNAKDGKETIEYFKAFLTGAGHVNRVVRLSPDGKFIQEER